MTKESLKRDFSGLPLREVGLLAGKDRLERLTGDLVIVLGAPEMTGEAARRGYKRGVDGVNSVRKDLVRRKDGLIQSVKIYTQQEYEAFTTRMNKIKRGAQSGFQKGVEMATTRVEFVVGRVVFVVIGGLAGGETIIRVTRREVGALPKEAKAAFADLRADWHINKSHALFERAAAKRTKAASLRMKSRTLRGKAGDVRERFSKNTKFRVR